MRISFIGRGHDGLLQGVAQPWLGRLHGCPQPRWLAMTGEAANLAAMPASVDFELIVNASAGAFLVLAPDSPRFTVLAATDAYLLATRQRRDRLLGRALADVFAGNLVKNLGPGALQDTFASLDRALSLRIPDSAGLQSRGMAQADTEAGGFEASHWRTLNTPVINAHGDVACLLHQVEEVSGPARLQPGAAWQAGAADRLPTHQGTAKALRESQRFLRSSLNALSGHVAVLDASGTILEINEAWRRFARENNSLSAGIGVNYLEACEKSLSVDEEIPVYLTGIKNVMAGRQSLFEMEYACHSPTQQRWFVMRVTRFQVRGPVRIVIVHDNCTQRKLAEIAMRESEERYHNLFNSMDEGFCIIDMIFDDLGQAVDCRFLEVNPAFSLQTGLHDAVGKRMSDFTSDNDAGWMKICGEVFRSGSSVRFTHQENKADTRFDIYAARLGGLENPKIALVINNITQRTRDEAALRESEQRFRALFDWGPMAMYTCDMTGTIRHFNAGAVKLWGRAPNPDAASERFCGAAKIYRMDGTLLPYSENPMVAVLKGERPLVNDVQAIIEQGNGTRITVIANIVPIRNGRGEITGAINCFYDVTERSRLEQASLLQSQALADLHRRKDEFLAMLSHELRNPLAPLLSAVELLRMQENENPLHQQACKVIERQVGQLKHLVDDLLEISRITSGNVRLRREAVTLGDIVEKALESAQPLILQRRHQLTVSLPPHPLWVDADATRMEQVLVNLLTNAAKYTDPGGCIWLNVEPEDDAAGHAHAVLRVRDSGIGIAPELLPHVFDLFTQAERSIDRSQGGMGIGLCLVRRLVELHAGTVEAHSVPGQGSEFTVRLPLLMPHAPPMLPPAPATPAVPPERRPGCRVLAVDDSVDAVESLAMLLRIAGHEVEIAYDGPSALHAALAMRPDVILLDIGLPGLTGYEVAQQIRKEPSLGRTVLVALTGYGRHSDRQRSQKAGFAYHLVKPVGWSEVEKILTEVREKRAQP
ncbi:MAG: multi-sensor hybrid histidine kinase [Polaromonas sp.]|nr:multi-sensor hybrid histidine kinase [Polaromonas sp.]